MVPSPEGETPLRFMLQVDAGSRRETSKQMRSDRAVQLFTLGAIDEQALLEDIDYPNAAAVAGRVAERKAQESLEEPGARKKARA